MRLGDVGAQAIANLARHKLRTALTLCGVGVGVATLTVMVSLGAGLQRLIENQVDKADLVTRISVLPKGTMGPLMGGQSMPGDDKDKPKITDAAVTEIAKLPGVLTVYPDVTAPMIGVELAGEIFPSESEGFPSLAISETHGSALLVGRYWTAEEEDEAVVVAPSDLLEAIGLDPLAAVGQTAHFMRFDQLRRYEIETEQAGPAPTTSDGKVGPAPMKTRYVRPQTIQLVEARVIGVYKSEDFGFAGRRFHAPHAFGKRLLKESGLMGFGGVGEGEYRALVVKANRRQDVPAIREAITKKHGFDTLAVADILKVIAWVFIVIDVLLGFFGGIGLVVSFFGIANTMVMAVLERTREIGVLKALGARDRDVRRVFLLEASAIGALGGGVGVGVGWLVGVALNALASYLLRDGLHGRSIELFWVPGWLALLSIGLSTLVAGVAGLYPAWRAARLDPVVSLRME